jgi:putative DNA primase/helicase
MTDRNIVRLAELSPRVLPPPSMPMAVARIFADQECLHGDVPTLRHWRGGWWTWRLSHWVEIENRAIRGMLYRFAEHAIYYDSKGTPRPWAPNRRKIGDLLEALGAICILPDERDQPCWLDDRRTSTIVAVGNGLLDVERRQLHEHTPQFFNQISAFRL